MSQGASPPARQAGKFAALAAAWPAAALPEPAVAAINGAADVAQALEALENAGLLTEAARLSAFALPRREAVWWACMCARHTAPSGAPGALLDATEAWVRQPDDEARRAAMALAEAGPLDTPEAWAAVAAFWSGDSLAPRGVPAVPPAPHLTGTAVAGSVALAAVRGQPARQAQRLRRFLFAARDIASGGAGRLETEAP